MIEFFYNIPFVKEIIGYLLIPILIFIIVCSIILLIYSAKYKDRENPIYKYKMNLASLIISMFLVIVFLSILIGFALAFRKEMLANDINTPLSYVVIASPLIPLIALIFMFVKMFNLIKNKPVKSKLIKEDRENLELMINDNIEKDEKTNVEVIDIEEDKTIKTDKVEEDKEEIEIL